MMIDNIAKNQELDHSQEMEVETHTDVGIAQAPVKTERAQSLENKQDSPAKPPRKKRRPLAGW